MEKRFDPKTMNAAEFIGVHPLEVAALAELGFTIEAFPCLRFHDTREEARWFYRDHELLGYVFGVADGGVPCEPETVLRTAREAFGLPCEVLWP